MQQPHAFEASSAPKTRRRNYLPIKECSQVPAAYPVISLLPSFYAVEIGASPTYVVAPRDAWRELRQFNGAADNTKRRNS